MVVHSEGNASWVGISSYSELAVSFTSISKPIGYDPYVIGYLEAKQHLKKMASKKQLLGSELQHRSMKNISFGEGGGVGTFRKAILFTLKMLMGKPSPKH